MYEEFASNEIGRIMKKRNKGGEIIKDLLARDHKPDGAMGHFEQMQSEMITSKSNDILRAKH